MLSLRASLTLNSARMQPQRISILQRTIPKLLRRGSLDRVNKLIEGTRGADIANLFRQLTDPQQHTLFNLLKDDTLRAEVLGELDADIARSFLESLTDQVLLPLLQEMSDDDAADILELLDVERAEKLVESLRQAGESDVADLFVYDPESAAGLMTTDFFALPEDTTSSEAVLSLREHSEELEISYYLYVINDNGHLVGVVSLRQLVLSLPETTLRELMESDVVRVNVNTDQEQVAQLVARYNLLAIPVVDASNRLVGVVTVDDIIDVIRLEATEDFLKMAGAGDELEQRSTLRAAKARLPWLMASFIGGVFAAMLIGVYEEPIAKVVPLAAFIPIILGMGGNVGIQSSTIVTRGLALGRIDAAQLTSVVTRELLVSVVCGVVYGVLLGSVAWIQYAGTMPNSFHLGATVGLSVGAAMIIAATIGGAIPMLFARFNIDPALASGPFVTTAVDVFGILSYFTIAVALLDL